MPRVGGTYTAPFPDVVPDTTIESEVHNGTVADLVFDANFPRPITAGGTGATSPAAARANLKTEVAGTQVTNYDSHVFEAGSFYSLEGATGGPLGTTGTYSGVCHMLNSTHIQILARAYGIGDGAPTYSRIKSAGTWGAWTLQDEANFVNITGDTMVGDLVIAKTAPEINLNDTGATGNYIHGLSAGTNLWQIALGNSIGDFTVTRAVAGVLNNTMISASFGTGQLTVTNLTSTTSLIAAGDIQGRNVISVALDAVANPTFQLRDENGTTKANFAWARSIDAIAISHDAIGVNLLIKNTGAIELGNGFNGRAGRVGAVNEANIINFNWNGSDLELWIDEVHVGNVTVTPP